MILKKFVVFEGIDGSGTSTQSKKLSDYLKSQKIEALFTNEPTPSPIGKLLRSLLKGDYEVTNETIAQLFVADRNEHLYGKNGIVEAIDKGQWVFCDRYHFSTLAYQSLKSSMDSLYQQNKDFPLPEILFFIDTPPEEADQRISKRNEAREIYESLPLQQKIRENYYRAFDYFKDSGMKLVILNGNEPIDELFSKIRLELGL